MKAKESEGGCVRKSVCEKQRRNDMRREKSVQNQKKKHNKVIFGCWLTCTQFTRWDGEVRIVKGVVGGGSGRVDPAADGWSGREEGRME